MKWYEAIHEMSKGKIVSPEGHAAHYFIHNDSAFVCMPKQDYVFTTSSLPAWIKKDWHVTHEAIPEAYKAEAEKLLKAGDEFVSGLTGRLKSKDR